MWQNWQEEDYCCQICNLGSHFPKPIVFNELSVFYEAKTFIDLNVGREKKSGTLIDTEFKYIQYADDLGILESSAEQLQLGIDDQSKYYDKNGLSIILFMLEV